MLLAIIQTSLVCHFLVLPQVTLLFEGLTTDLTTYGSSSSKMGLHVSFVLGRFDEVLATDLASVFDRRILSFVFDSDMISKTRFMGVSPITLTAGKRFSFFMSCLVDLA